MLLPGKDGERMTELRSYFLHVTAACLLVNLAMSLLPKGKHQGPVRLCGSLVIMLTIVAPILRLGSMDFAKGFAAVRADMQEYRQTLEEENSALLYTRIKQEFEAYVWDKATALGLSVEISLRYTNDAAYPYPVSAVVKGRYTHEQKLRFQTVLEEEMGIAKERQVWIEA